MQQVLQGLEVLVVEDDAFIQLDLQMILEDAGATVITASTLKEAFQTIDRAFHAAILDITLPDGEVRPVAEVLAKKETPIIFHSSVSDARPWASKIPRAIAVSKPVADHVLIDIIQEQSMRRSG